MSVGSLMQQQLSSGRNGVGGWRIGIARPGVIRPVRVNGALTRNLGTSGEM